MADATTTTAKAATTTTTTTTTAAASGTTVEDDVVDDETAAASVEAAKACDSFGGSVKAAVDRAPATDDPTIKSEALAEIDKATSTALADLKTVTLPGDAQATLDEIVVSIQDLSTEIGKAIGDEELTKQFFEVQPPVVAVAVSGCPLCFLTWVDVGRMVLIKGATRSYTRANSMDYRRSFGLGSDS